MELSYQVLRNGQETNHVPYDSITMARTKMREMYGKLDKKYCGTPRFMGSNSCSIVVPYGIVHFEIEEF